MQWSRGAPLRPFLEALEDEEEKLRFHERLRAGVAQAYIVSFSSAFHCCLPLKPTGYYFPLSVQSQTK
jgi:hypothetical protein